LPSGRAASAPSLIARPTAQQSRVGTHHARTPAFATISSGDFSFVTLECAVVAHPPAPIAHSMSATPPGRGLLGHRSSSGTAVAASGVKRQRPVSRANVLGHESPALDPRRASRGWRRLPCCTRSRARCRCPSGYRTLLRTRVGVRGFLRGDVRTGEIGSGWARCARRLCWARVLWGWADRCP
jgi:hypothetical protein